MTAVSGMKSNAVSRICGCFRRADSPGYAERASRNRKIVAALLQKFRHFRVLVGKEPLSRQLNLRNAINGVWRKGWLPNSIDYIIIFAVVRHEPTILPMAGRQASSVA